MTRNPLGGKSPITIDTAEKFVRDLLKAGVDKRKDAEKLLATYGEIVQREVGKQVTTQIGRLMKQMDQMEKQIEALTTTISSVVSMIPARKSTPAPKPTPAATKTSAAKKTTAKKSTATKTPAAKKTTAKKTTAKKTTAKKSAPKPVTEA